MLSVGGTTTNQTNSDSNNNPPPPPSQTTPKTEGGGGESQLAELQPAHILQQQPTAAGKATVITTLSVV